MAGLVEIVRKEWQVLRAAPGAFISLSVAAFLLGYAACSFFYPIFHPPKACTAVVASPAPQKTEVNCKLAEPDRLIGQGRAVPHPPAPRANHASVTVGDVSSTNQTGGITAGYVGQVEQGVPR